MGSGKKIKVTTFCGRDLDVTHCSPESLWLLQHRFYLALKKVCRRSECIVKCLHRLVSLNISGLLVA
ncbi:hypothetical protein P5673_006004 [Acropora cervicornis]|uniref:Uncharacterized protein n=1 Tax=Acropora cervicornis TaxID=6130 RepID=A0AAD9VC84_ACRCE|nr:hypothetical protein P5673_006004 [Acropora cervicornis]